MWKGDPIIRARLHRRDDGDDPKLAFRDAFPPATLHCVLQVEEDTGEQAALRDVGADGLPLAMTGLWERWKDRGTGNTVQTFTMTTVPNELCGPIHDRMPVILPREKWATWVGEHAADPDELRWMILRPYPPGLMRAYPVGAASRECAEQRRRAA